MKFSQTLNYSLLLFLVFFLFQCDTKPKVAPKKKSKNNYESAIPNQLSAKEITAGWELLFDGKNTNQWRGFQLDSFPNVGWRIDEAGNLVNEKSRKSIVTKRRFENFDLKIDFQIAPKTDAGIFYRTQENQDSNIWNQALEYQIIDPQLLNAATDFPKSKHGTGDLYDFFESEKVDLKPTGEWNRARVVVLNNYVEHWLNGILILQFKIEDETWKSIVTKNKFRGFPFFGKNKFGLIGLEKTNGKIIFRNIKIKEL